MLFKLNAAAIIWCLNDDYVQRNGQKGETHIFGSGTDPIEASLYTTGRLTRQKEKKQKIVEDYNYSTPPTALSIWCTFQ